jgi:hypothetical protein
LNVAGVGPFTVGLTVRGNEYTFRIVGIEANIAYNAFLVCRTLLGLRARGHH